MSDQTSDTPQEENENKEDLSSKLNLTPDIPDLPPLTPVPPSHKSTVVGGKLFGTVLGLLLLAGGVGAGVLLVLQPQLINQKAADLSTKYKCSGGAACPSGYKCNTGTGTCELYPSATGNCGSNTSGGNNMCYVKNGIGVVEGNISQVCDAAGHWTNCSPGYICQGYDCVPTGPTPGGSTPPPSINTSPTPKPTPTPTPKVTPVPTPPVSCSKNLDIAIVFDRSSTMTQKESDGRIKLEWAKDAARGFVQAIQNTGTSTVRVSVDSFGAQGTDGTGVLTTDYNSTLNIGLTNNLTNVISAIDGVKYSKPGTCIECGLKIGNSQLASSSNKKVEILLSDGMANHNWDGTTGNATHEPKAMAIDQANTGRSMGIEYRVLGYGLKSANQIDESTLLDIAGYPPFYQYKPDVAEWSSAFMGILGEICGTTTPPTPTPIAMLKATEDAYVSGESGKTTTNFGASPVVEVDGSPIKLGYMQFDLSYLANKNIKQAILVLNTADTSAANMNVSSTSTSWKEATINYSNKPALGTAITPFKGGVLGYATQIDITSFVNANKGKFVSLAINSASGDGFTFTSKEANSAPYILVY